MSEEIKSPGTELHDATLSGVGGGVGNAAVCQTCAAKQNPERCKAEPEDMAGFVQWNRLSDWRYCPFLKKERTGRGNAG